MEHENDESVVELYRPANEVEAREVESLLQAAGVACSLVSSQETPYPSVGLKDGTWGKVLVPASRLDAAEAIVRDYIDSQPEPASQAGATEWNEPEAAARATGRGAGRALLTFLALVVSVAFNVFLWARLDAYENGMDRKGRPLSKAIHASNLVFPYEWQAFDVRGEHMASWFDADGNGRTELVVELKAGEPVIRSHDSDQDGWYERSVIYKHGEAVLAMLDENDDGLFETAGVPQGDELAPPLFHDVDGDGRYDLVECEQRGRRMRFNVRTCSEQP